VAAGPTIKGESSIARLMRARALLAGHACATAMRVRLRGCAGQKARAHAVTLI
jgi:hypothetical protein